MQPANELGVIQPKGFPGLPEGWVSSWETFPSSDGKTRLFGVLHHPHEDLWAGPRTLLVVHGMGEHSGRYLHFPYYLGNSVDAVYAYDHRGHGRSEGLQGHIDQFDAFTEDLKLGIRRLDERLKNRFGKSEIHLFAHSLGGLIALQALFSDSKLPIESVALSAPLLGIRVEVPFVKKFAAVTLSRLWGSLQLLSEVNARYLSHDQEVVQAYLKDRLVHKKVTPRMFTEMTAAMENARKREIGWEYPVLMQLPEEDQVTNSETAIHFFRALKHRDKLLKTYPGFFHESFNEVRKELPFEDLQKWLNQHQKTT